MKCSKCGGEIRNLPDYIEETGAEVLCTQCAGFSEQGERGIITFDRFRGLRTVGPVGDELEVAA